MNKSESADSPIRASAQAQAKLITDKFSQHCYIMGGDPDWSALATIAEDQIYHALDAEARGRQQAEQARDAAEAQCAEHQRGENEALNQVSALAQALKDYGQHWLDCQRGTVPYKCTCGLDAALTGAQA